MRERGLQRVQKIDHYANELFRKNLTIKQTSVGGENDGEQKHYSTTFGKRTFYFILWWLVDASSILTYNEEK